MESLKYKAVKTKSSNYKNIEDTLVIEAALQININDAPYTVVMRTPNDDYNLIRGLLYAEDIYKSDNPLALQVVEQKQNGFSIINATIPSNMLGDGYMNKRTLLSVSSCGICGKQELKDIDLKGKPVQSSKKISLQQIKSMYAKMKTSQHLFSVTGGSHATAAFTANGQLLSVKEDIGRHNALDKVIGDLLNKNQLKSVDCILVSGRVSYEIVSKAFIAMIPVIVAVSACSSLAVDFAKEFGICLIGFSRDDKATIYANANYVDM